MGHAEENDPGMMMGDKKVRFSSADCSAQGASTKILRRFRAEHSCPHQLEMLIKRCAVCRLLGSVAHLACNYVCIAGVRLCVCVHAHMRK